MEKKTASDMRLFLSSFEPEYPVKKGYIARLIMNEKLPIAQVARKIIDIVKAAEPDRQIHEHKLQSSIVNLKRIIASRKVNYAFHWTDFVNLNQQTFNISFKGQMVACTHMPIQENTPEIPAATDLTPEATNEILPALVLSGPSSPKRLRRDCDSCVAKQRTSINMLKEIKRLRQKIREQNRHHRHFQKEFEDMKKQFKDMTKQFKDMKKQFKDTKKQFKDMKKQFKDTKKQFKDTKKQKEML